jgi:rod shape-determining protein MreC
MRRILQFIKRNQYSLVFLFIMIVCLRLYNGSNSSFNRWINSYSLSINAISSEKINNVRSFINLRTEISNVEKQNEYLLNSRQSSFVPVGHEIAIINDTINVRQFAYHKTDVINNKWDSRDNYFIINGGEASGFRKGMGVCSSAGVVGIVDKTSSNFSRIKSILSSHFNLPCYLSKQGDIGYIKWTGDDINQIDFLGVSRDTKVNEGDTVLSFGSSIEFPKGVPVGVVAKSIVNNQSAQQTIILNLFTNISSLQNVFVIENILIEERKSLLEHEK